MTNLKWQIDTIRTILFFNNKIDFENGKDDLFLVKTIYIGGGTPSLIDSKYIVQIMKPIPP